MKRILTLYGTKACHLCEDALSIIESCPETSTFNLILVDVADDEALEQHYGLRIPVLRLDNKELNWPFDQLQYLHFLRV